MPFTPPEHLPKPEIKPVVPKSAALAGGSFTTVPPGRPHNGEVAASEISSANQSNKLQLIPDEIRDICLHQKFKVKR